MSGEPLAFEGICYSGYREGQNPDDGTYPSAEQVTEDLRILSRRWRKLRLYDSGPHADRVLNAIVRHGLDLEVMLGAYLHAEQSNPHCPWGGEHGDAQLEANAAENAREVDRTIALANRYPTIVTAVAVGNEAVVSWTDHLVPVPRLLAYVRYIREAVDQPITSCDNHVPWLEALAPVVPELDFVSVHTYPVWEYRTIGEALAATDADYRRVADRYPDTPVAITEAGWTTRSNGRGIDPANASPALQARYYRELSRWIRDHRVPTWVFEAFDEPWKGSDDPGEPEKHWGLFTVDRRPKPAMRMHYPDLG